MKIAYVSHDSRPNYEYNWFSRIPAEKVKFIDTDFSAYPSQKPDNVEYCQVESHESRLYRGRFHSTAKLVTYSGFEQYLADVDLVIVLELFSSLSRQFVDYCRQHHIRVVVLVYELIPTHPLYYLPSHIRNRLVVAKQADKFICVTQKAKESLVRLGINPRRTQVVYPGIDLDVFAQQDRLDPCRNILFVGRLERYKGIDILLDLANEVLPRHNDVHISVVGQGSFAAAAKEFQAKYPNFHYLGPVPNGNLPNILKQHAILVMPCREMYKFHVKVTAEQFGFSVVEAMACGLAVVTTTAGALPEVVNGNNIVVEQNQLEQVITSTERLLANNVALMKLRQDNAQFAASRYNITHQGRVMANILKGSLA